MAHAQDASESVVADPSSVTESTITFIGNATVLVRYAGFNILTDPNFLHRGQHARLGYGLRSRRRTEPAMQIRDLPSLDLIVLSHFHEDHFDRVAARHLDKSVPIVSTDHAASELTKRGFTRTVGLDTWRSHVLSKGDARILVTATPAQHGPRLVSKLLPPTMGSIWEFEGGRAPIGLRIYQTGDTLIHDALHEIPRRYPEIDLALTHLGGTRILGVLVTMDANQGVEMIRIVQPRTALPIHYDDYTVFTSTLRDFQDAVQQAGLTDRVRYLRRGESYQF